MVINAIQLSSEEIQRKTGITEIRKIKRVTGDKLEKMEERGKMKYMYMYFSFSHILMFNIYLYQFTPDEF